MAHSHVTSRRLEVDEISVYGQAGGQIGKTWKIYTPGFSGRCWAARWYWGECGEGTVKVDFGTREQAEEWVREMERAGFVPETNWEEVERVRSDAEALVMASGGEVPREIWGYRKY